MNTNGQTFDDNRTTTATELACSGGFNGHHLSTGAFSLVLKHRPERAQSRVVCGQGQIAVVSHKREGQILNSNIAVGVDDPARRLVPEVAPRIGDLLMQHGDLPRRFLPIGTAFLTAGHSSLSDAQGGKVGTQPARIVDDRSIGQGQQVMQANVNTNVGAIRDDGFNIRQFHHQANIPLAERPLDDDVLDCRFAGNLSVQDDLNLSDVLNIESVAGKFTPVAGPVFDRLESLNILKSGMTGTSFVERLVRLIDATKHLLDRRGVEHPHLVGQGVALVAHPVPLLDVSHRPAGCSPLDAAFVERVVVDGLHLRKEATEQKSLLLRRAQSVFVRADHLLAFLLVNVPLNRFCRDVARRADVIRARPQGRQSAIQVRELAAKLMRCETLEPMHNLARGQRRRERAKQVNVIGLDNKLNYFAAKLGSLGANQRIKFGRDAANQNGTAKFWYPNEVIIDVVGAMSRSFSLHKRIISHMFYQCKSKETALCAAHIPLPLERGSTL